MTAYATSAAKYLEQLRDTLGRLDAGRIGEAFDWIRQARDEGRTIYICGIAAARRLPRK